MSDTTDLPSPGQRVRVLEWRPADNDQSTAPCLGTVVDVVDGRVYVRPDGLPGSWLALRMEPAS